MNQDRLRFLDKKRQLQEFLDADIERQWAAMCQKLVDNVTRSIWQE